MVYRTQHVEFIHAENASDHIVVTFNGANTRADGKTFWGDTFLKKNGISALGIVATRPNWFPRASMEEICAAARPILQRYRHVCTYGNSMGGYGALKWSAMLGADTVVALSPQHTIDPKIKEYRSPYSQYYVEDLHQDVTLRAEDLGGNIFVFYDPFHALDLMAAEHIASLGPINRMKVPMVGHNTSLLFARSNSGLSILRLSMEGKIDELRRFIRETRRTSWLRYNHLACAVVAKHPRWAFGICEKFPEALDAQRIHGFCNAVAAADKLPLAIEWASGLAQRFPLEARGYKYLAWFHLRLGNLAEAKEATEQALRLEPKDHRQMLTMSRICQAAGANDEAVEWARKSVASYPRDPEAFRKLVILLREIGRPEEALVVIQDGLIAHPNNSPLLRQREIILAAEQSDSPLSDEEL